MLGGGTSLRTRNPYLGGLLKINMLLDNNRIIVTRRYRVPTCRYLHLEENRVFGSAIFNDESSQEILYYGEEWELLRRPQ
jgi:hypothetical protein